MEKLGLQAKLQEQEARATERREKNRVMGMEMKSPLEKLWVRSPRCIILMKSGILWIVTLAVLSASLRLRNGSVSIGPCTIPHC